MQALRVEILEFFKGMEFNAEKHEYSIKGKKFKISASGIYKKFQKPFDRENISYGVARSRGISQLDVYREWESAKELGCRIGNESHLFGELYPFNRELKPATGYQEGIVKFWEDLPSHIVPVIMELQMYHKNYMFPGTGDILLYNKKTKNFIICDYKTNKNIFKNHKGQKLLGPFSNLLDNPYNTYQIQISLYQLLFEQTGYKVSDRRIVWVKPDGSYSMYDTEDYTSILKYELDNKLLDR